MSALLRTESGIAPQVDTFISHATADSELVEAHRVPLERQKSAASCAPLVISQSDIGVPAYW
jgi:hypothetical protein